MSSASPWAVAPEAEGVAAKVEEPVEEKLAHNDHEQTPAEETTRHSALDSSEDGEKIHTLARALTEQSIKSREAGYVNPFDNTDNPLLNPLSDRFSPRAWMKVLIGIQSRDPDRKAYSHTDMLLPLMGTRSPGAVLGAGMIPLSLCLRTPALPLL